MATKPPKLIALLQGLVDSSSHLLLLWSMRAKKKYSDLSVAVVLYHWLKSSSTNYFPKQFPYTTLFIGIGYCFHLNHAYTTIRRCC